MTRYRPDGPALADALETRAPARRAQLDLQLRMMVEISSRKMGPCGRFEAPRLIVDGAGEGAFGHGQTARFEQAFGGGAAVDADVRPVAARAQGDGCCGRIQLLPVLVSPTSKTLARDAPPDACADRWRAMAGWRPATPAAAHPSGFFVVRITHRGRFPGKSRRYHVLAAGAFIVAYGLCTRSDWETKRAEGPLSKAAHLAQREGLASEISTTNDAAQGCRRTAPHARPASSPTMSRGRQRRVDSPAATPCRSAQRHAELQRLDPGVAGDVESPVRLAAGLAAGQAKAKCGCPRRSPARAARAVPDDVRLHVARGPRPGRSPAAQCRCRFRAR